MALTCHHGAIQTETGQSLAKAAAVRHSGKVKARSLWHEIGLDLSEQVKREEALSMVYSPVPLATQEKIIQPAESILDYAEMLPEDWDAPSPDDLVASAFWNSRPIWSPEETTKQNACLLAWERGQISGVDAFGYLDINDLLDHDAILLCYLAYLMAKAGGELV